MTTPPDHATEEYPTVRGSVPPLREWLRVYVIGLFMGTADAVPGVSGGTIALIAGIYERLIAAVTAVTPQRFVRGVRALLPLDGGVSIPQALDVWETVDGWFLIALLAGVATAIVTVTGVVEWANEEHPILLFGFFFGLIAASAVILLREIEIGSAETVLAAVTGFSIAFVVSGQQSALATGGLPVVFLAGAVAVSAMILPGISGSLFLVILGQYTYMSETLQAFIDDLVGVATGASLARLVENGTIVATFILGGLVGLFTVARVVRRALDANRTATLAFLVALVVGALRAPVATLNGPEYEVTWTTATIGAFATAAVAGAVIVLVLDWYAVDIDLETV